MLYFVAYRAVFTSDTVNSNCERYANVSTSERIVLQKICRKERWKSFKRSNTSVNLTFRWPCIVIYSYNRTNDMHWFLKFIFGIELRMSRTGLLSVIRFFLVFQVFLCFTGFFLGFSGFSWFPCVYKQMLRWFPTFQVATTCLSWSPPDLNVVVTNFMFCIHVK